MDEELSLSTLIEKATLSTNELENIQNLAQKLILNTREAQKKQSKIETLLHKYDLSTNEGIALMCLAEALLRIPDKATIDKFISDKLSTVDWKTHLGNENPLFVNAATWSLLLAGKIYAPTLDNHRSLASSLKRATAQLGASMIRPVIMQMMKVMGKQFVMGETIDAALTRSKEQEAKGYRYSYDMLGEAARTSHDAERYYQAYVNAIDAIGQAAQFDNPMQNPGISVKLSALHPRYEFTQRDRVLRELPPLLLSLAQLAKKYRIGLTVDAEEVDRLDLSLDIIEIVYSDPSLSGWEGFGLAVQAYQKRAFYVLDWLSDLIARHQKRMMVRLVKGAYWDSEIKVSQVQGFADYPVFTRKNSTDTSYIACARKMLERPNHFYSQFGTHNAYTIAAILEMAKATDNHEFEFQCLHGMGQVLYDQIVDKNQYNLPCRIYAPVGTHKDLLAYLVRRLLENGANTSFVNLLANDKTPIEKMLVDPVDRIAKLTNKSHPSIPLPKDIYGHWQNSEGIDLANPHAFEKLKTKMDPYTKEIFSAGSIVNGKVRMNTTIETITSPANSDQIIGHVSRATDADIEEALKVADQARKAWSETPVQVRAEILERAAALFQQEMPHLITLMGHEGGKCIPDCIAEIRETIDYCRYYAYRARHDMAPVTLPGPTGESNELQLHPRGTFVSISPWNFPLAIFSGQILAALVTGNTVIAKPAEQTPLTAFKAVQILHQAGIPKDVLQLLIGSGSVVGAKLVKDSRIAGVLFTGSTETAKQIELALANREGPIAVLVAETGGQNAMIVDSSALLEQVVIDIAQSAFNSAGQRCSALRVLFVQEEIADSLIEMLKGYMAELKIGNPTLLSTDIGSVIDDDALQMLKNHFGKMSKEAKLISQIPLQDAPNGHYFAPCVFELASLDLLEKEVFGPILHIIRFKMRDLDKVMDSIVKTGYGLTLGIESRVDATIKYIASRMSVGNIYVNRNMIGAVVGVQPFGGERLSGTGPKAGGPHYLPRLCVERTISTNTVAVGGNARLVSLLEDDEWPRTLP